MRSCGRVWPCLW